MPKQTYNETAGKSHKMKICYVFTKCKTKYVSWGVVNISV